MSKKVFNVFSILCFALVLCFIGCTELINPKTETDINLNIDLSKIIKSTRNTEEIQSSVSIGENPTIKVAIYDAKKYNATTNSTGNLDLITEAQAKIENNKAKVKLNNIPVGIYAIVFAELSFSNGNSTKVMYAGNSEVFRVEPTDNKIRLVLTEVVDDDEVKPDDSNTPYKISSWDELKTQINKLSDDRTTTEFVIANNLTATSTITVNKLVKITSDKNVTISRGNSSDGVNFEDSFFKVETSGSLELEGKENITITLDGGNQSSTIYGGAVYVSGGTFTMNNSSIINCSANENGGAVYVSGGTFNMNGGSITGCSANNSGGGVCMNSGSSFTMSGDSKIDNCYSCSGDGGGVYVTGEDNQSTFKMLEYATITECSADNGVGGGIYLYGKLTMNGGACVESSNDVYLARGTTVTVAGELTYGVIVATITPSEEYTVGTQVLTAENSVTLEKYVSNFALSDETSYKIDSNGKLALASQNYAAGLTCVVDSDNNTVTLYIRNADGLAIFRKIVNGSFDSDIIVQYENNSNSPYTFYADNEYQNVNAVLESDITLSGDWTPIGVYPTNTTPTEKPYSGTFDGNGKTITFYNITHESTEMYSSGLFQMLAGTVKNLIIDGSISRTATGYIGGITGYLNGGTIENCVNKASISNVSMTGTGGIVGYVGTAGGKITGCINLGNISSKLNAVGGIVGTTESYLDSLNIEQCINLGQLVGESYISGILGNSGAASININNCINLGTINAESTSFTYASGITTPSAACTVSSCINVGEVTAIGTPSFQGGISSVTSSGIYINNYYDSQINSNVTDSDIVGCIEGKSTSELIDINILLTDITTDNWSFAYGRYLLPNIAGSIPGGENGVIWQTVIAAAKPDVTTGGGNEPLDGTKVSSLVDLQNAINGNDEVIIITSNITITDPLVINRKIKICTSDSNYQLARATEGTVKGPMFEVTYAGELTLQNIIITGGYDSEYDDGENNPFIYNNGKTVIEYSTLKNNYFFYAGTYINNESKSIHFFGGGAIFSNGDLTINNSSMENFYINTSTYYGGTIYIESGTCNIDGLTISDCSSNKNGAALYISGNASSSTVNINNSKIVSNTAVTNGGGIYAAAGTININNSKIVSNTAVTNGGGIYAAAGTININNSEINNNSAQTGKSVYFKKNVIYSINSNELVTVTTEKGYDEDITPYTSSISFN